MVTFTKTEIEWMAAAILHNVSELQESVKRSDVAAERSLLTLRSEQLSISANKLLDAVHSGNRRIEIKY